MKLLVSGIGKRNVLVRLITKEAKKYGIDIIGADALEFPPARVELNIFKVLPLAEEATFIECYKRLIREECIYAFISLIDPEISFLEEIANDVHAICLHPGKEVCLICEDKYQFALDATKNNINVIETQLTPFQIVDLPFIRKDRRGSAASGFHVFDSFAEDGLNIDSGEYVYQRFCGGKHYCIDSYFSIFNGELIDICVKEILNKSKGESYLMRSVSAEKFALFIENVSNWINLKGIINFDVYEVDGVLNLMEINCRIGGNYPASHLLGCNLLRHMIEEVSGGKKVTRKFSDYMVGKTVTKYLDFCIK